MSERDVDMKLDRAADEVLAGPIPATLDLGAIASRARVHRRRQRVVTVAACVAVLFVVGGVLSFARRGSSAESIGVAGDPSGSTASTVHVHRFRFLGTSDPAQRQITVDRIVQRYRLLGFNATVRSITEEGFELSESITTGSPVEAAQALTTRGDARLVASVRAVAPPCEDPALPQIDPVTRTEAECYTFDDAGSVDAGDAPIVRSAVAVDAGERGALEAVLSPAFAPSFDALAAACEQRADTCPDGRMLLAWEGTSVLAIVRPDGGGQMRLDGLFDPYQAKLMGAVLQTGRLPVTVELVR